MTNKRFRGACFVISVAQIVEKPTDYNILLNMLWPDSPLQNADVTLKTYPWQLSISAATVEFSNTLLYSLSYKRNFAKVLESASEVAA